MALEESLLRKEIGKKRVSQMTDTKGRSSVASGHREAQLHKSMKGERGFL